MGLSLHLLTKIGFPFVLGAFALGYRLTIEDAPRAARLFPDALIGVLVFGCLLEIGRTVYGQWVGKEAEPPDIVVGARQVWVLLAMVAFYPAVLLLGFAIPSLLFLLVVSRLCGATARQAAFVTAIAGVGLYLFMRLTGFDLPLF